MGTSTALSLGDCESLGDSDSTCTLDHDQRLITLIGEFDDALCDRLLSTFAMLAAPGEVTIDCAGLSALTGPGLTVLLSIRDAVDARGYELWLVGVARWIGCHHQTRAVDPPVLVPVA